MSEPDNPRWLSEITDELRREVPVRAAWRSRLLEDVARAPRPSVGDNVDDRFDDALDIEPIRASRRRSIVLSPLAAIAAAVVFVALGAGVTYTVLSPRTRRYDLAAATESAAGRAPAQVASTAATSSDREVVRFELSAPSASRVSLVGSFNEWNPVATPLARDAGTGKWSVSLRLPPGRHVYAFVVDGDVTADPTAPRAADDDFGSTNSVILVSAPRT